VQIDEQQHGAVTVLRPRGPITGDDAEAFAGRLEQTLRRTLGRFLIDASAVAFLDSRGLESLADASEQLAESGLALKMCATNETVREVLDLTDVASRIEQFEDVNSAVRSFL